MCKRKGCKYCYFYHRDDDELTDYPKNFESDKSDLIVNIITIISVIMLLAILGLASIFIIYYFYISR